MYASLKSFIFGRKNKPGVTSTSGPHKPCHHYKTKVPKVQHLKPEALQGQDRVPGENIKPKSAARAPLWPWAERRALGPSGPSRRRREAGRRAGLPPEPGDSRPSPRRCPFAESGSSSSSDSGLSPAARPGRATESRRRPPKLGPAGSVRTRRRRRRQRRPWPPLPHRPGPTAAATRAAAPTPGPTAGPRRPGRGGGAGLLPKPHARVHHGPVTPRAGPRRYPSGRTALGSG